MRSTVSLKPEARCFSWIPSGLLSAYPVGFCGALTSDDIHVRPGHWSERSLTVLRSYLPSGSRFSTRTCLFERYDGRRFSFCIARDILCSLRYGVGRLCHETKVHPGQIL